MSFLISILFMTGAMLGFIHTLKETDKDNFMDSLVFATLSSGLFCCSMAILIMWIVNQPINAPTP